MARNLWLPSVYLLNVLQTSITVKGFQMRIDFVERNRFGLLENTTPMDE